VRGGPEFNPKNTVKKLKNVKRQWSTPVILEAELRRIAVLGQPRQTVC
jgi:hypothetical protein